MILTKEVDIIINSSNIKHYKKLGFNNIKVRDKILVNIDQLTKGSYAIITAECDVCHSNKEITYNRYLDNIGKYDIFSCSRKCANIKRVKTNLEKYGVEYVSQSKIFKDKIIKTCLEKYGVEYVLQSKDVIEKGKNTKLLLYGNENFINIDKAKKTNLKKYGFENPMKDDNILNKMIETNLNRYGTKYYMSTAEFKEKSKKTNLDKYGVEKYKNIEKTRETFFKKYGVDWYTKSDEYKEKTIKTNLKRYGTINPNQNDDIRKKSNDTRKINRLKELSGYNIINIDYDKNIYTFMCDSGNDHIFEIEYDTFKNRKYSGIKLCTVCNNYLNTSGDEINIYNFIKEKCNKEIILNSRLIISPLELDIYIPELKLAFEFNGLYWHNEISKERNYHLNKTELCQQKGIQLIHIWEDEWNYKKDIVKSMILNKLGKTSNKIYARKCIIKEIYDNKLVREFLDQNHIQGFVGAKVKLGLFYENELVSLMTFGNRRIAMGKKSTNEGEYELLRFCNKLNNSVIGGAYRLFSFFIKNYNPIEITTYADRSISKGQLYNTLGFTFIGKTQPNYYYIIDGIRHHRFNFRKDILIKKGFDPTKTEHEIMLERKIFRIYDSGNLKFIFNNVKFSTKYKE